MYPTKCFGHLWVRFLDPITKVGPESLMLVAFYRIEQITTQWLFQLDDEPNPYIGNSWTSPFPTILNLLFGGPGMKKI